MTTDQAAPAADDPQAARWARREPLLHLLGRLERGVILDGERPLLRAAVEAELVDGDQARQRHADLNAAYGADLRSVERERDDFRADAARLRQQLTAAKAEAEGLAETMRNTDRLTTQQPAEVRAERDRLRDALDRERRGHDAADSVRYMFGAAGGLTPGGVLTAAAIRSAAERADTAEQQLAAERAEHETHRREMAEALACFPTSSWADLPGIAAERITQRQRAEDRAERAERHAAADVAAARQAEELAGRTLAMRHQRLAEALHCDLGTSWRDLIQLAGDRTGVVAAMRQTVTRAEQNAAAARQGEAEAVRARQAAEAQRRDVVALLNDTEKQLGEARRKAEVWRVDAATQGQIVAQRTEQAEAFRNAVYEALAIAPDQLPATAISAIRGRAATVREQQQRAERAEAAIARVRKATDALTPLAARHIEEAIAEPEPKLREVCCVCGCPDVTYHNHREQPFCCRCAMCCEPPTLCAHGCQPADATAEAEEQREQPAEPLLCGIDLTGYTAGMQAFMTAYVQAVAPALDQVARALGVTTDGR